MGTEAAVLLPYDTLMAELRRLCVERRTGTLFITTTDNHAVRVVVRGGAITAVRYRQHAGAAALAPLKGISGGKVTFSADALDQGRRDELPPTSEILAMLGAGPADVDDRVAVASPPAAVPANFERVRPILESELAEHLGPMAQVVCGDHLARAAQGAGATTVPELIEHLAAEIGDARKSARFKEQVRARLSTEPR